MGAKTESIHFVLFKSKEVIMRLIKCNECDYEYTADYAFIECPKCMGSNAPEKGCACEYFRFKIATIPIYIRKSTNPNCPVHGSASILSAIAHNDNK